MVKYFSVDWLSQSDAAPDKDPGAKRVSAVPLRPHVPCVVQPRQPSSYDRDYLQPKPKSNNCVDITPKSTTLEPVENVCGQPDDCSSPISEISGYSSGYDSEAASSDCPSVDEGMEADQEGSQRRVRTKFTPEQIQKLEKIFNKHKYLDAGERAKTAMRLNLSETQVRTWFQNRRMKVKREVQDLRAGYLTPILPAILYPPVSSVQYHGYRGQQMPFDPSASTMLYSPLGYHVTAQQMPYKPIHAVMPSSYYC